MATSMFFVSSFDTILVLLWKWDNDEVLQKPQYIWLLEMDYRTERN
jgi:hypothetical protein